MAIDIVIDLETLGTRPGCPIIEIGACAIDPNDGRILANFNRRVASGLSWYDTINDATHGNPHSSDITATCRWWHADDERKKTLRRIMTRVCPKNNPFQEFCEWFERVTADAFTVRVWGNGPTFDLAILSHGMEQRGVTVPWHHTQERCVRTALEQAAHERGSVSWIERGPRHRALNDARHEARELFSAGALGEVSAIMRRLRERGVAKGEAR